MLQNGNWTSSFLQASVFTNRQSTPAGKNGVVDLRTYLVGLDITDKKRKRALLLHYSGEEVNDVFDTLSDTGDDYDTALRKLTDYFAPKKCTEYEVYQISSSRSRTIRDD